MSPSGPDFLSELSQHQFSADLGTDVVVTVLMAIAATVVIYLALFSLVRVLGTRTLANLSTFDFACMIAVGAVVGRTAVLGRPNLLTGVVALLTLFTLQGVFGFARTRRGTGRLLTPRAVVIVRDGVIDLDALRRVRITQDELRLAVRRAGLPGLAAVGLVVLEQNGTLSVVRAGDREAWLEADLSVAEPVQDRAER
ncbi:DUF421 domain-containing protein [Nocardioides jiangxiensis]|uniref:DUF421 domain-containing protein n=1 Tax=Nocardioides jiangxiensis TaxID=3064524 RepID=A0ABT9AZG2_9ACTN|nr:YetF domain-containing protein [Nocardioides sp. WY-20]MDO7867986.1 DUF421 domain-containing protein [Nocardioides sp. WY-20]